MSVGTYPVAAIPLVLFGILSLLTAVTPTKISMTAALVTSNRSKLALTRTQSIRPEMPLLNLAALFP